MKGLRYVGGNRDGRVEDIADDFVKLVLQTMEEAGERAYVVLGRGNPPEFVAALRATGVKVLRDSTTHGAWVFEDDAE